MKAERRAYAGHSIELRKRGKEFELLIDGVARRYGRLPDGKFYLAEYAYDWSDDLLEVAQRFIDHRKRAEKIRKKGSDAGRSLKRED